jgi:PAS domain S-box-containing protein
MNDEAIADPAAGEVTSTGTTPLAERLLARADRATGLAAAVAVLVGGLVLLGWELDIPALKGISPGLATMKVNLALGFVAAGASLWLSRGRQADRWRWIAGRCCAALVFLIGLLTLIEFGSGRDLGIDHLIIRDEDVGASPYPGRMAPASAFNDLLVGLALLFLDARSRRGYGPAPSLALLAALVSLLAILGYAYGVDELYRIYPYSSMAWHTAATFLVLCLGILLARPDRGPMAVLLGDSLGGLMARRLLPTLLILFFLLGWLNVAGREAGLYGDPFGTSMLVLTSMIVTAGLVWWNARSLALLDVGRRRAEEGLRDSEARMRGIVEAAVDGIVTIDERGTIESLNPAVQRMFGYPADELLGRNVATLMPAPYRAEHDRHLADDVRMGRREIIGIGREVVARRKDGSTFPVELTVSEAHLERRIFTGIIRDITPRKQAEEALRRSEERFRLLVQNSSDVINALGADGTVLYQSRSMEQMLGHKAEDRIGRNVFRDTLVHPDDLMKKRAFLDEAIRHPGVPVSAEFRLRHADGSWRHIEAVGQNLVDDPRIGAIVANYRDITERRQAEEAQRRALERVNSVLASITEGYFLLDSQFHFVEVNPAASRMIFRDRPAAELIGRGFWDLFPEGKTTEFYRQYCLAMQEKREAHFEAKSHIVERWFEAHAYPRDDRLEVYIRDVTDRKRAEEELRNRESELRTILDMLPVGVWLSDAEGRIVLGNPEARRIWAGARFVGIDQYGEYKGWWVDTGRPIEPREWALARALLDGETSINEVVEIECFDGSHKVIHNSAVPIRDEGDRILGALVVNEDITGRRRAEEQRQELLLRLVTAQEDERRRIARELHDQMGQYLSALALVTKALMDATPADLPGHKLLQQLQQLTNEMGLEAHRLAWELRPSVLDDMGLVAALENYASEWSERNGVELVFQSTGLGGRRLAPLLETNLYRIVQEALTNIAKHARATHVGLVLEQRDGDIVVVVEDDGRGFDADATMSWIEFGGQLGLRGMRERAALFGGTMAVESSRGEGTAVFVRIPPPRDGKGAGDG